MSKTISIQGGTSIITTQKPRKGLREEEKPEGINDLT